MRALICIAGLLLTGGCVTRPIVSTPPAACAALVPERWAAGVDAEPIPDTPDLTPYMGKPLTDSVAAFIAAPYAQAYAGADARLGMANGRTRDAIGIFSNCESAVNAARPRAR